MVPKAMALFIVKRLGDFIKQDLLKLTLNHLEEDENYVSIEFIKNIFLSTLFIMISFIKNKFHNLQLAMIGPSAEDVEKFKAKQKMYESCKRALEVMII